MDVNVLSPGNRVCERLGSQLEVGELKRGVSKEFSIELRGFTRISNDIRQPRSAKVQVVDAVARFEPSLS